ncbi:hypothetical protein M422DRAFT_192285 [Sphaerobolus stellatus SS14]|uniref:Uncharacterized protein n=1 Tax=Sphaerobolus stellatus (strain SS14) TaxID=990650 RepID=A0A0C9TX79_SPHS4|nr:hypothetical protein M422DRAFT_192285 [Sphaerobolus stellatus SS14]
MQYYSKTLETAPKAYSHSLAGTLNASCGVFWTAAYLLYVKQAREDRSYGMPLLALILNVSWEFVYTFVYRRNGVGRFFHFPWVFIDGILVVETIKYGPDIWRSSPAVAENFGAIVLLSVIIGITAQWTFASQFSRYNASFWSAYACQNVLSWGSLWMLLARGNITGHSMSIWWCRFLGSLAANLRYVYRAKAWPQKYEFISGAFSTWMLWMPCLADLMYPLAYNYISERMVDDLLLSNTNATILLL